MILLSFNVLANTPEVNGGSALPDSQLLNITANNTHRILNILKRNEVSATFFMHYSSVEGLRETIMEIFDGGSEVALYNDSKKIFDLKKAKILVEGYINKSIKGIRQQEGLLPIAALRELGFVYLSETEEDFSVFSFKKKILPQGSREEQGMTILPESLSPYSRLTYNGTVFQMVPLPLFKNMMRESLNNNEYVMMSLDTRQFTDFNKKNLKIPFYRKYNTGIKLEDKLEHFLHWVNQMEIATSPVKDYLF